MMHSSNFSKSQNQESHALREWVGNPKNVAGHSMKPYECISIPCWVLLPRTTDIKSPLLRCSSYRTTYTPVCSKLGRQDYHGEGSFVRPRKREGPRSCVRLSCGVFELRVPSMGNGEPWSCSAMLVKAMLFRIFEFNTSKTCVLTSMTSSWLTSWCINISAVDILETSLTYLLYPSSNQSVAEPQDGGSECSHQN